MKLSRRGKSARRRRHTKRTGKHLRCRGKKVSGSKRYHRGHKRTYKRGKRFQRGGEDDDPWKVIPWTEVREVGEVGEGNPPKKQATGLLVYKKDSTFSLTSESKYFLVTLETLSGIVTSKHHNHFNFMKFKVTMERYKDDDKKEVDKTFTVYFAFGYYTGDLVGNYYLIILDESGNNTVKYTFWDQGAFQHTDLMPVSVFDGRINHIALPKEFSNIIGYDNPYNTKYDKYIFYVEYKDKNDKTNYYFIRSLATEMYNIFKKKRGF